jgi:hypothetical protein
MIAAVRPDRLADASEIGNIQAHSWRTGYKGLVADELLAALFHERRTEVWSQSLIEAAYG